MPMTPTKLRMITKSVTWTYLDDTDNHLTYRPGLISQQDTQRLAPLGARMTAAAEPGGDEADGNAALLEFATWVCSWLVSWDFLEDDGETMQAITPEHLADLLLTYTDYIIAAFLAAVQDKNGGKASAPASSEQPGATSSPTATLTSSPPSATETDPLSPSASSSSPAGSPTVATPEPA